MANRIAIIPARGGSVRIPNKNLTLIAGRPLISYAIATALSCKEIDSVFVSTDSKEIEEVSIKYGAKVPGLRPEEYSQSLSPDIHWINHAIENWLDVSMDDQLVILRPTNPLRKVETISKAIFKTEEYDEWHSLRAVRPVREHPRKTWIRDGSFITPFLPEINRTSKTESHSSPMQALEELLVQDASLEITKVSTILKLKSLSGSLVIPFTMPGLEGFDINYPEDLEFLDYLLSSKKVTLPPV